MRHIRSTSGGISALEPSEEVKMTTMIKMFTVLTSPGYVGAGNVPRELLTNEALLRQLRDDVPDVEFIARDMTEAGCTPESVLNELEHRKADLDGVLIVGASRLYGLALSGLPTIVVYNLFEWMNIPYKLYATGKEPDSILVGGPAYGKGRIVTAQMDRRGVTDRSSAMYEDLLGKIRVVVAMGRLKRSRILSVSSNRYLAQVDYQGDLRKSFPEGYNERYAEALKASLGVEIERVPPEEFYQAVAEADRARAEAIADDWIGRAAALTDTTREEVIHTASAYLAFDALRERHGCNAVSTHMRSLTGSGQVEDMFWPGLALECGFKVRGIQAVCQDYPNILVTQLLGYYLTGRPSMLGDLMIDTFSHAEILTHCGAPINPHGEDRVPYTITSHAESPVRGTGKPGSSTGITVELPLDETVTVWKVYALHGKVGFHTGRSIDGRTLYGHSSAGFDEIMCRTKLVLQVRDAAVIQRHYSPDEYGIHRAATYGDLTDQIRVFGVLAGFDMMDEEIWP
jgi:hypothetical protein